VALTLPGQLTLTLNPNFFCTNNAPFAIGNKHAAEDVSCLRMTLTVIFYFLNAGSGRLADGLINYVYTAICLARSVLGCKCDRLLTGKRLGICNDTI